MLNSAIKIISSALILYAAFNIIFRYHQVIRIDALLCLSVFVVINFYFFDNHIGVLYFVLVGLTLLGFILSRIFHNRKNFDSYFLISVLDKDKEDLSNWFKKKAQNIKLAEDNYRLLDDRPYILYFYHASKTAKKMIFKDYEKYIQSRPKPFTFIQYFSIIIALILLISIWRF